jgi:hypothetical protein
MFAKSLLFAAAASAATIPTRTTPVSYTETVPLTGVTHTIVAGVGLTFQPFNNVADVGDVFEWHFKPKAHGVVQSSFDKPCLALPGGFSSGLVPVPDGPAQSDQVFQIVVENKDPIWYYCPQLGGGEGKGHCQNGMVGVVNAKVDVFNIDKHREAALNFTGEAELGTPGKGYLIPNPNPLAGI